MKSLLYIIALAYLAVKGTEAYPQCALILELTKKNAGCPCSNGAASVTVTGGTAPYTYQWTNDVIPGTVTLYPEKDNSIYQQMTTNSNGRGEYLVAGVTGMNFINRALLYFRIKGNIPAGASVIQANLQMHLSNTSGTTGAINHSLHRLNQNWGESNSVAGQPGRGTAAANGDATWLKNFFPHSDWTAAGGSFHSTASASRVVDNTGYYTWSGPGMRIDVQSWLDDDVSNFGWLLKSDEAAAIKSAKQYGSRENAAGTNRPILTITYGPSVIGNTPTVSGLSSGTYHLLVTDAMQCMATITVTILSE